MTTNATNAVVDAIMQVLVPIADRITALEAKLDSAPASKSISAPAKVAKLAPTITQDAEVLAFQGQLKATKFKLALRCAAHSSEALLTYRFGGGQAARAFMADGAGVATLTDIEGVETQIQVPCEGPVTGGKGLVQGSLTDKLVATLLSKVTGKALDKPTGKAKGVKGNSTGQATKRASSGAAGRPLSMNPSAVATRAWRKGEVKAGRDPYRSKVKRLADGLVP